MSPAYVNYSYIAVFHIHIHATNANWDIVFFNKTPPKCIHSEIQKRGLCPSNFPTISAKSNTGYSLQILLCLHLCRYCSKRRKIKHSDVTYTPVLLDSVLYFDVHCPSCQLVFYRHILQVQFILQLWVQTTTKAKGPSPRMFTLLEMKLEGISHMLLVKKANMNFNKMLYLNATIFVDNYWKIDWYKSWKK